MAIPGLLVEYLVIGSMALLWLLPVVGVGLNGEIPFGKAAALAPAMYVIGMFVDFVAYLLVSRFPARKYSLKALARWYVKKKPDIQNIDNNLFKEGYGRSSRGTIWLYLNAPDLIKELQARSSRDRIARGAIVNILLIWLLPKTTTSVGIESLNSVCDIQWIVLVLFSIILWAFFEANSYGFELRAGDMVPKDGS